MTTKSNHPPDAQKSETEWRVELPPERYHVLREKGTEAPGSSALLDEHRQGLFRCAADARADVAPRGDLEGALQRLELQELGRQGPGRFRRQDQVIRCPDGVIIRLRPRRTI